MTNKTISSASLQSKDLPSVDAGVSEMIEFAHTFDGYACWRSFERCAEIANARDHSTIDKLRTCLFFEARRWRNFGEAPDDEALHYWRSLIAEVRMRLHHIDELTPEWLSSAIDRLPSDAPVPDKTQGYNVYNTQKDHWLGWLNPRKSTGTYARRTGSNPSARKVYNGIGEPKMLRWLISVAGVDPVLVDQVQRTTDPLKALSTQCAEIRRIAPWRTLAESLMGVIDRAKLANRLGESGTR